MTHYSLRMDRIDITCYGDTEEHYLYVPYMPSMWDSAALLRWQAKKRWGWWSRGARRRQNVVQTAHNGHSDGA